MQACWTQTALYGTMWCSCLSAARTLRAAPGTVTSAMPRPGWPWLLQVTICPSSFPLCCCRKGTGTWCACRPISSGVNATKDHVGYVQELLTLWWLLADPAGQLWLAEKGNRTLLSKEPCGRELGRWITPFRRRVGRWLTDVTLLSPLLSSGQCRYPHPLPLRLRLALRHLPKVERLQHAPCDHSSPNALPTVCPSSSASAWGDAEGAARCRFQAQTAPWALPWKPSLSLRFSNHKDHRDVDARKQKGAPCTLQHYKEAFVALQQEYPASS